jgi:hypothetical protein
MSLQSLRYVAYFALVLLSYQNVKRFILSKSFKEY